jgi:hypothetical protein
MTDPNAPGLLSKEIWASSSLRATREFAGRVHHEHDKGVVVLWELERHRASLLRRLRRWTLDEGQQLASCRKKPYLVTSRDKQELPASEYPTLARTTTAQLAWSDACYSLPKEARRRPASFDLDLVLLSAATSA